MGFSPPSDKQSILVYKKKNHYNEWEFVYDPLSEQMNGGSFGGGLNTQPISNSGSSTGGINGGGFGTPPPEPTPPQQPPPTPPQQ